MAVVGGGVAVPVSVETKMVLAPILLKVKGAQSCPTVCDPMDYSPWNSPGQNTGVASLSLLKGIFPTQVSRIAGRFFTI